MTPRSRVGFIPPYCVSLTILKIKLLQIPSRQKIGSRMTISILQVVNKTWGAETYAITESWSNETVRSFSSLTANHPSKPNDAPNAPSFTRLLVQYPSNPSSDGESSANQPDHATYPSSYPGDELTGLGSEPPPLKLAKSIGMSCLSPFGPRRKTAAAS